MNYRFYIKPELCIACKSCEVACAFSHPVGYGEPGASRINIELIRKTPEIQVNVPVICLQCDAAACELVCPTNALQWNRETDALEMHNELCTQCQMCVAACPFGNIFIDPGTAFPVKCDLCGGDPKCVKFCPTKAISYEPVPVPAGNTTLPEQSGAGRGTQTEPADGK
jgi:Fe-S-cluster-containing hydrogenase component 2